MLEKVERSLKLAEKIDAVDVKDAAEKIINLHFIRDLYGNLKSFGTQRFRCVNCNETFRRVPLIGKCPKCGGKLVLTVTKGGIVKYLEVSQKMAEKYQLNPYIRQRLKIFEKDVNTIFKEEKDSGQKTLADFFNV
jgi:DNA polymerase II large subunit